MSRKHYIATAAMLNRKVAQANNVDEYATIQHIAESMADIFKADNPRFDRDRFLTACGF